MSRVLIIGATSAVAQEVARKFAQRGDKIFCFARNEQTMESFGISLGEAFVGSYCFDFKESDKAPIAISRAFDALGEIDLAFFAHGSLPDQMESEKNYSVALESFETNCLSIISLLIPLTEQMIRQKKGKIGVITSVAGERGRPRNYTYGAAKGALTIYLQGLRSRLWKSGIEVYNFKMGPVDTPMTIDHEKNFSFSTVEKVASIMVKAFKGKRYEIFVPGYWAWVMLAVKSLPESMFQRLKFLSAR